jgi:transcriptional regulator with XRE-family HTH domain
MEKAIHSRKGANFRALLVEAREKAGLTQQDVAARLNKTQSFVSYYEKGSRRLDVLEFLEVAEVLRADPVKIIRQLRGLPAGTRK